MRIRNTNRLGVTVRLNLDDQVKLRELMNFWGWTQADVLKQGFYQMYAATQQIIKNKEAANEVDVVESLPAGDGVPSGDSPAPNTNAASAAQA